MHKNVEFILDGVIVITVLVLGIGFAVRYIPSGGKINFDATVARFKQYAASEDVFKSRYTDYQGSCQDLALPSGVRCVDSVATYKVEETLQDGSVYCIDSTGFAGKIGSPTAVSVQLCH